MISYNHSDNTILLPGITGGNPDDDLINNKTAPHEDNKAHSQKVCVTQEDRLVRRKDLE